MITHIALNHKEAKTSLLFRASDGVMIGQVDNCVVLFGESSKNKESRVCLDHEFAQKYMREVVAMKDLLATWDPTATWKPDKVIIEDRSAVSEGPDGKPLIYTPEGAKLMEFPGSSPNIRVGGAKRSN